MAAGAARPTAFLLGACCDETDTVHSGSVRSRRSAHVCPDVAGVHLWGQAVLMSEAGMNNDPESVEYFYRFREGFRRKSMPMLDALGLPLKLTKALCPVPNDWGNLLMFLAKDLYNDPSETPD